MKTNDKNPLTAARPRVLEVPSGLGSTAPSSDATKAESSRPDDPEVERLHADAGFRLDWGRTERDRSQSLSIQMSIQVLAGAGALLAALQWLG